MGRAGPCPERLIDMSNASVAAKLLDSFIAGDLAGAVSVWHPDCVVHESRALPYPGDWHGPAGFTELVTTMTGLFDVTFAGYEIIDNGEMVSMRAHATFTAKATGRSLETSIVEIYRFADGRIVDADIYYKDPSGIRELTEQALVAG
jgi:ketosteroid isomerase-like protein